MTGAHGGGNLEVNTVTPSQVPCCCWANSANWVTRGLINSVLLLGCLGWVLGGEAKLAVMLLGFATGVTVNEQEQERVEAFIVHRRFWKCC